jgi:hypothetical protein
MLHSRHTGLFETWLTSPILPDDVSGSSLLKKAVVSSTNTSDYAETTLPSTIEHSRGSELSRPQ